MYSFSGERGIRTPGPLTVNGFQDRRNRPLCHLSAAKVRFQFLVAKIIGYFFYNELKNHQLEYLSGNFIYQNRRTDQLTFIKNIPSQASDDELISNYQSNGDMETLSTLYQRYMELVYGVCLKYFQNTDDAKDAVINIFEELIVKLKKHQVTYFKAWLYQVAKNHCLMALRKKKKTPHFVDTENVQIDDGLHLEEVMSKETRLKSLEECIQQLAAQQKESVTLFYLKGKCYKEIATSTGIDVEKIRSFIQNGRRNLKICMDKKENETNR